MESYKKQGLLKKCASMQAEFGWTQFLRAQKTSIQEKFELLDQANMALQDALDFFNPQAMPLEWAGARSKLGNVFQAQALAGDKSEEERRNLLDKAAAAYEDARAVYDHLGMLEKAHLAKVEFASALQDKAASVVDTKEASELADKACLIYQETLNAFKSKNHSWIQEFAENNLANTIYFRARLCDHSEKDKMLQMAIDAYRSILKKHTGTIKSERHAYNQVNLGFAFRELALAGPPEQKRQRLLDSLKCFAKALRLFTPEAFPDRAANAQIGLGLTQFELSQDETLSQDKRDWFFKESLMNLFEGTTLRSQDAEFIKNGREAIKMLREVTIPEPNKANDL